MFLYSAPIFVRLRTAGKKPAISFIHWLFQKKPRRAIRGRHG